MNVAIVKYNAGNIRSVQYALERLNINAAVSDDPEILHGADKVIFPGVGEAASAMQYLRERNLDKVILDLKQPVLGICLGMQLMCTTTEEGNTNCLGIFNTPVRRFAHSLKVPQVGWNTISTLRGNLFKGVEENAYCYFVHSYYADLCEDTIAKTAYGIGFSSALARNNFYGVQFHAEKSAETGQRILQNFLSI